MQFKVVNRPPPVVTLGAIAAAVGPSSAGGRNALTLNNALAQGPTQQVDVEFAFTANSTGIILLLVQASVDVSNAGDTVFFLPVKSGSIINLGVFAIASAVSPSASSSCTALARIPVGTSADFGLQVVNNTPGHTVSLAPNRCQVTIIEL